MERIFAETIYELRHLKSEIKDEDQIKAVESAIEALRKIDKGLYIETPIRIGESCYFIDTNLNYEYEVQRKLVDYNDLPWLQSGFGRYIFSSEAEAQYALSKKVGRI